MLKSLFIGWNTSLLGLLTQPSSYTPEHIAWQTASSLNKLPLHQDTMHDKTKQQLWSTLPWNLPSGNTAIPLCVQDGKACSSKNLSLFAFKAASTTSSFSYQEKEKKKVVKKIKMETYLEGAVVLWLVHWTLGREV